MAATCLLVLATTVMADAPETSLRPVARPQAEPVAAPQQAAEPRGSAAMLSTRQAPVIVTAAIRPQMAPYRAAVARVPDQRPATAEAARPSGRQQIQSDRDRTQPAQAGRQQRIGLFRSLRPLLRSRQVEKKAVARRAQRAKGAVCGDPDIQGTVVGRVSGRISGCGIENAVRIRSVKGIPLSREATIDCTTAKTLKAWVQHGLKPAVGATGGGVARIRVIADYACRTRNNQRGAKISEHGKGRAVDIAGFTLRDGSEISVLNDWNRGHHGKILRHLHGSACGPFGTVLGPESDRFHRDHFHFDTASYRNGSYCR